MLAWYASYVGSLVLNKKFFPRRVQCVHSAVHQHKKHCIGYERKLGDLKLLEGTLTLGKPIEDLWKDIWASNSE